MCQSGLVFEPREPGMVSVWWLAIDRTKEDRTESIPSRSSSGLAASCSLIISTAPIGCRAAPQPTNAELWEGKRVTREMGRDETTESQYRIRG